MLERCKVFTKGNLRLYEKTTNTEITHKNLVVKNSSHIAVLGLGGDINKTEIRMSSWGDMFEETPSQTGYNWTKFESLEEEHILDANHTHASVNITGHSYPGTRSIRFTFELNKDNISNLIGKNILEWGLFFNGVMFSRVALETEFAFQNWMTVVGEWTIVFSNCSGGYSNFYLNQYDTSSLWGMSSIVDDKMEDYAGLNNLTGVNEGGIILTRSVLGETDVDQSSLWLENSLATLYPNNTLYIYEEDQDGGLDLRDGKFTIWQWFKLMDPASIGASGYYTLVSKWVNTGSDTQRSYRLKFVKTSDVYTLVFEINDNGTISTLTSTPLDFDEASSFPLIGTWCFVAVRLAYESQTLDMYFNGEIVATQTLTGRGITPQNNTTFYIGNEHYEESGGKTSYSDTPRPYGFIGETCISKDTLSDTALDMLWNSGSGDFYIS